MKKVVMALALIVCAALANPCYGENGKRVVDGDINAIDTLSYSVGVAHAAAMKADKSLEAFDFNITMFNKGLSDYLTGEAKHTYAEVASTLEAFFLQTVAERRAEFEKKPAEGAVAVFKAFVSDSERDEISYLFGIYIGEELRKPLYESNETLHLCWLCKGFEDVYAETLSMSIHQMMNYLKSYKVK